MASLFDHLGHAALYSRGFRRRWVGTTGGRVHVLEHGGRGTGPPLVLLAGFSSRATNFARMAPHLLPHVSRLSILDLPGHGDSDLPPDGLTGTSLHQGVLETLASLSDEPAVIFGNSVGGWAALSHALAKPQLVRGLVLASPFGASMTAAEVDALREVYRVESHADALEMVDRVFHEVPGWFRPVMAWFARRQIARPELMNLLDTLRHDLTLSHEDLAPLRHPIKVLWGQSDGILPREHLGFFRQALPHATFEEPHDYGHSPFMQRPRDVAERILGFLDGLVPPDAGPADRDPPPPRG